MTAKAVVGQFMKLIEDNILVRNTAFDKDFARYLRDSARLVQTLNYAEDILKSELQPQTQEASK